MADENLLQIDVEKRTTRVVHARTVAEKSFLRIGLSINRLVIRMLCFLSGSVSVADTKNLGKSESRPARLNTKSMASRIDE